MGRCEDCDAGVIGHRGCTYCAGTYCLIHRLPENHGCSGVRELESTRPFETGLTRLG
jgi:predicted nucleic acid binding AN1-type Zn finger protein